RVQAPSHAAPGSSMRVAVVADCTAYPDLEGPVATMLGFGFTLSVPSEFAVASVSWGEDVSPSLDGEHHSYPTLDGTSVGAFAHASGSIAHGYAREILRLELVVDPGALTGATHEIGFDLSIEEPVFLTEGSGLRPHRRGASVTIAPPIAAALAAGAAPSNEEPTPEELSPQWLETGGGGMALGAGGPPLDPSDPCANPIYVSDCVYCQYETRGGLEFPPPTSSYVQFFASGTMEDIQCAVIDAIDLGVDAIVLVAPGTYTGTLAIDVSNQWTSVPFSCGAVPSCVPPTPVSLSAHVIIAAYDFVADVPGSPEDTFLQGNGGPAVCIFGSTSSTSARLSFGWHQQDAKVPFTPAPTGFDARGWRGFQITGGEGSNVHVAPGTEIPGGLEIRGHWIHDNEVVATVEGGGIDIDAPLNTPVQIIFNDISDCTGSGYGGGIRGFNTVQKLTIARNYIHHNEAEPPSAAPLSLGGGIHVRNGATVPIEVDICKNFVYENSAVVGAGISLYYAGGLPAGGDAVYYVEANDVYDNRPLPGPAGYPRGGGIAVQPEVWPLPLPSDGRWQLGLVRNRIYGNGRTSDQLLRVVRGGGVYLEAAFEDGEGPFGLHSSSSSLELMGQLIVGNTVHRNFAEESGAGIYYALTTTLCTPEPCPVRFWSNTIWENDLTQGGAGAGLYVAEDQGGTTEVTSCIVHDHDLAVGGGARDWYAADPSSFGLLHYPRTRLCSGAGGPSPVDLVSGATQWDVTDPAPDLLQDDDPLVVRFYTRQTEDSESINKGENPSPPFLDSRLRFDVDGDVRVHAQLDVGADEFLEDEFVRGDANADGTVDISDAVFCLESPFLPGSSAPSCFDAADANDDSGFDISDPVSLLAFLFSGGAAPPAPFPGCGTDPTVDDLVCVSFAQCP
ncbi:MAG: right-handed parallel beta-helix repeat-containing protein, partial [Candidatus Eisenbacteria bacterium]|nr:right-handed parallel beta-helix repeat-containing protein [Candidatus Eisenbacteria bacterium]